MMGGGSKKAGNAALVIAAYLVVLAWGVAGLVGVRTGVEALVLYDPDYVIRYIEPGDPLDQAGLQVGDSVVTVEGIAVEELGMYSRYPRSLSRGPGESLLLGVDREGERLEGRVVYRAAPPGSAGPRLGATIVLLSFMACGLWAFLTVRSPLALHLAYIGLALGVAIPGPNTGAWRGLTGHIQTAGVVLWTLLLLRFFLLFPKPKRVGESRAAKRLLFSPWVLLLVCMVLELLYHPRFYHTFAPLYGLLMFVYGVSAVVAATHTVVKTPRDKLRASGMGWIQWGVMLALGGTLLALVDWALLTGIAIPGSAYLPMLIAGVPLTMALAVRQAAASQGDS